MGSQTTHFFRTTLLSKTWRRTRSKKSAFFNDGWFRCRSILLGIACCEVSCAVSAATQGLVRNIKFWMKVGRIPDVSGAYAKHD